MSDKPAPNISDAIENLRGVVAAQLLRPGQPGKPGLLSAEELRSQLEEAFKIMMLGRDADGGRGV